MDTKIDTIDPLSPRDIGPQEAIRPLRRGVEYSASQNALRRILANDLQRLNKTIADAVEAGMTVELVRRSRYHAVSGSWGDQMMPVITCKASYPE